MKKFKNGALIGIGRDDLKDILLDWIKRNSIGMNANATAHITLHPKCKYVVRMEIDPQGPGTAEQ